MILCHTYDLSPFPEANKAGIPGALSSQMQNLCKIVFPKKNKKTTIVRTTEPNNYICSNS